MNLFTLLATVLATGLIACSSPALLLEAPGDLVLEGSDGSRIELDPGSQVGVVWGGDGSPDSTTTTSRFTLVPTVVVEANARALRLKSERWSEPADIPAAYLGDPRIALTMQTGRYGKPVVTVPLDRITRIVLFTQKRQRTERTADPLQTVKWMGVGAAGGAILCMTGMVEEAEDGDPHLPGSEALLSAVICGAGGAVLYPIYKHLREAGDHVGDHVMVGTGYAIGEDFWLRTEPPE